MKIWPLDAKGWMVLVFAFAVATQLTQGAWSARHLTMLDSSHGIQGVVLSCLIACWLSVDSRGKGILRVWDMGFFLCMAWPVIIPYYLVKTRGFKRTILSILLFTVVYVGAYMTGQLVFRR